MEAWLSGCPPEAGPPLAEKRRSCQHKTGYPFIEKMACVYILFSETKNNFYVGSSRKNEAIGRLKEHNAGRIKSTKSGLPWIIVYEEQHLNYTNARKRELFLKSGVGRKWIKEKFWYHKL